MTGKDLIEFGKIAHTLKEHSSIIDRYEQRHELDRNLALTKWDEFNKAYPEFYYPSLLVWKVQNKAVKIQSANDDTIVNNLILQRDWLIEEVTKKWGGQPDNKDYQADK